MARVENKRASHPDEDNPEWTGEEVRRARPALDVIGEVFGAKAADSLRRRPGRPLKANKKVNQTLRLDADVLAAWRLHGKGWQARINRLLREHMGDAGT